jgi:hypothetical protein
VAAAQKQTATPFFVDHFARRRDPVCRNGALQAIKSPV